MIYDIWDMIADIWYMIDDIWYIMYHIWHMIYEIWNMKYEIWYLEFERATKKIHINQKRKFCVYAIFFWSIYFMFLLAPIQNVLIFLFFVCLYIAISCFRYKLCNFLCWLYIMKKFHLSALRVCMVWARNENVVHLSAFTLFMFWRNFVFSDPWW